MRVTACLRRRGEPGHQVSWSADQPSGRPCRQKRRASAPGTAKRHLPAAGACLREPTRVQVLNMRKDESSSAPLEVGFVASFARETSAFRRGRPVWASPVASNGAGSAISVRVRIPNIRWRAAVAGTLALSVGQGARSGALLPTVGRNEGSEEAWQVAPKTARVPYLAGSSCVWRHSHEEDESTERIAENRRPRAS